MSVDNPQLEDGYTPIANTIMEALARTRFSGYERNVLDFLFRKTYGWSKKSDIISLSQFVDGTGITKPHIVRTINRLVQRNIVCKTVAKIGNDKPTTYEFNKHFGEWIPLPKQATLPKQAMIPLPKQAPTISIEDTTSRKTTKSESQPVHHKFKIPHVVFDPMTLQLSGIDDEARRAFSAACPKANLDDCLERLKAWIIKKGVAYENYWRTLCTIGSGDQTRGGTHGTDRKRGYRPSIEDAVFTGEDFIHSS